MAVTTLARFRFQSLTCLLLASMIGGGSTLLWGQESAPSQTKPAATTETPPAAADPEIAAVRAVSEVLVAAYNAGDAATVQACFTPQAELVDDAGNVYRGAGEIGAIFKAFRERFPNATMELAVDAIRLAGAEIAVEDGTRAVTTEDATAVNKYSMVYVKRDGKWLIAAARETAADPDPTPHDRLLPLVWLLGEWVDEGADAAMAINCHWDDGENFLLIEFTVAVGGEVTMNSSQRIGWDPHAERIRSWVFDSDGGYGEGKWANADDRWVVKSTATMPDGDSGSATIYIEPIDNDKFLMKGFDRIVGDTSMPDFEATIVRNPPAPAK